MKGLSSIDQKEFYQQNYKSVYGIEIRGEEGKIRFGTVLSEEEKAWLVSDFRKQVSMLRGETQADPQRPVRGGVGQVPIGSGKSVFSIPFPKPKFTDMLGPAFMILFGLGFVCVGLFFLGPDSNSPKDQNDGSGFGMIFDFLDQSFGFIWIFLSSIPVVIGMVMMVKISNRIQTDKRIEGNEAQIAIRKYKSHLILSDQSFPRHEVTDVRSSDVGLVNNVRMKRVDLIVGNRVEKISHWMSEDVADQFVRELRSALSK